MHAARLKSTPHLYVGSVDPYANSTLRNIPTLKERKTRILTDFPEGYQQKVYCLEEPMQSVVEEHLIPLY
jgi:hypothetical protein